MSSVRGVNVGGNLFGVTDSTNIAPIETTNFATRAYAKDRCFIMADGLLYRATAEIESGDPIVINGNCKRTTLDEIISVIETDSDLIAPTEDGATSSANYTVGSEIVRSGILYKVISAITQGDAFAIGSNIEIAGSLTSQIQTLANQLAPTENGTNYSKNYTYGAQFFRNNVLYEVIVYSVSSTDAIIVGTNCALAKSITEQLSENINLSSSVAVNDNITSYLTLWRYGNLIRLNGLLVVNNDIPINTDWLYVPASARPINATAIGLISIGTQQNRASFCSAHDNKFINQQDALSAGTYMIDATWFSNHNII